MRSLRLIRYLHEFGWVPTVLTANWGFDPIHGRDETLESRIPEVAQVLRVHDPIGRLFSFFSRRIGSGALLGFEKLAKTFFFPDEKLFWGVFSYLKFATLSKTMSPPDLIYATGFPWTSFVLGLFLKRRLKKPLVVDFRDAWSLNPTPLWRKFPFHRIVEKIILAHSDMVIFATRGLRADYETRYPQFAAKMIHIYNGFDPEDFAHLGQTEKATAKNDSVKLIYAGSLSDAFPPKVRSRSLIPFLQGIAVLKDCQPELFDRLDVEIFSNDIPNTKGYAHDLGISRKIRFLSRISHEQVLRKMSDSDILLLIVMQDQFAKQIATAKLFEYIAIGKPVLALAPKFSEAAAIVDDYQLGVVLPCDEIKSNLAAAISQILQGKWEDGNSRLSLARRVFDGRNIVGQFASTFDQVTLKKHKYVKNTLYKSADVSVGASNSG